MKRFAVALFLIGIVAMLGTLAALAEGSMSPWPFFVEVNARGPANGIYQFTVPLQVMDKARGDLADLRLYDSSGREIPYALRIRREVADTREISGRLFNQVSVGTTATEVSVDLGEDHSEHNEVEIDTEGMNFRRLVDIEGSASGKDWKTLGGDVIYSFGSQTNAVRSNRASYVTSRYRYLRVRVFADQPREKTPPTVTSVKVSMAMREKGVATTWDVGVPSYQLLRHDGAPASSWTIDLGAKAPCDRLLLTIDNESFSRPFELEVVDDPQNVRLVATGELTRRLGEQQKPLTIVFDNEEYARKLRLLITDYNNPTLSISAITASAPARQLFFELKQPVASPMRLFFGNAKAVAPHYDFEKELSSKSNLPVIPATEGSLTSNPEYKPEPLPFTERLPWLIYIVLTISSVVLAWILFSLARATMKMENKPANSKSGA